MRLFPGSTKGGGQTVAFPDVCKVPAPPAPFVPIPYLNVQFQQNLKRANKVDANAKAGGKRAVKLQKQAIDNLEAATGERAQSATQAVMLGKTAHARGATLRAVPSQRPIILPG
jgi:hypothetical protein